MNDIGKKIKDLRKSRNMRQDDLGHALNLSRGQISNIENSKRSVSLAQLQKICEVFKIDLDYFGITPTAEETINILERAKLLFESEEVPTEVKDDLYLSLMQVYIKAKKD